MDIFIPIAPVPKARARVAVHNGRAHAYTPAGTAKTEKLIKEYVRAEADCVPRDMPVEVSMVFLIAKPPSVPKKREWPTIRPDLDNLAKLVMDAIQGYAFADDAQVVMVSMMKRYVPSRMEEGVHLVVKAVPLLEAIERRAIIAWYENKGQVALENG